MMTSVLKCALSVKRTDEKRNDQHIAEQNTDKISLALENQQA
jgi:hypothetical protein